MIVLAGTVMISQQIFAQVGSGTQLGITITPPLSEIALQPGKTIIQAFNIQNTGGYDLEVTPSVVEFVPEEFTGDPLVQINSAPFPYTNLQNLDKQFNKPFVLKAGAKDQLVVRVAIPENHPQKDYYQTLLLKTQPVQYGQVGQSSTTSLAYVGVHMLIRVTSDNQQKHTLEIDTLTIPKIIDMFTPLNFTLTVKNSGTTYEKSYGNVSISSLWKKDEKVFNLLPQNVLAQSTRPLSSSIIDPENTKNLIPAPFRYDPAFLLGPISVEVQLQDEEGITFTNYSKKVFALPLTPALIALVVYCFRFVITIASKRNKNILENKY